MELKIWFWGSFYGSRQILSLIFMFISLVRFYSLITFYLLIDILVLNYGVHLIIWCIHTMSNSKSGQLAAFLSPQILPFLRTGNLQILSPLVILKRIIDYCRHSYTVVLQNIRTTSLICVLLSTIHTPFTWPFHPPVICSLCFYVIDLFKLLLVSLIKQYLSSCVYLTSLNIISFSYIHNATNDRISYFVWLNIFFQYIQQTFYPFINQWAHLGWLYTSAIFVIVFLIIATLLGWHDISLWLWFVFSWLLVRMSIFHITWSFVYLLLRNVYSDLLPI
jgi:hypothetical protein